MINKIKALYQNVKNELAYRRQVRQTYRELDKLSNAELWDIGISRGEIYHIAHSSTKRPEKVAADIEGVDINANMRGWV
jgi:uncharacterized protein YjiS (DUF1127 family)